MTPTNEDQRERIIHLWQPPQRWTLQQIADEFGITRQRVSQILIEAGYSPSQRRAEESAARHGDDNLYRLQRATSVARRTEQREQRIDQIMAIADELGVKVLTLGQYAVRSGAYSLGSTGKGQRYNKGRLPARDSVEGKAFAKRVRDIAHPWSAMHLAMIASRRPAPHL